MSNIVGVRVLHFVHHKSVCMAKHVRLSSSLVHEPFWYCHNLQRQCVCACVCLSVAAVVAAGGPGIVDDIRACHRFAEILDEYKLIHLQRMFFIVSGVFAVPPIVAAALTTLRLSGLQGKLASWCVSN